MEICSEFIGRHFCLCACVCVCQYKEGKKLKPKPNYNSVDLLEVEWEDTEEKVGNTHSHTFLCFPLTCGVRC